MKTRPNLAIRRSTGFALGTVLVLSLIMLAAVGALLGYSTNEYRAARRNQYATEAFHLAEEGIARGVSAAYEKRKSEPNWAGDMPTITTMTAKPSVDPAIKGRSLRVTTTVEATRATIYSLASLETTVGTVSRAIKVEYAVPQVATVVERSGPAIGGDEITLGYNGNGSLGNHYSAFRSSLGKPVWNPCGYYKAADRPDLWVRDSNGKLVTNCFDNFRVVGVGSGSWDCNIGAANIYGHVVSKGAINWAREPGAPDKPAAWVGEDKDPGVSLNLNEYPFPGWVPFADQYKYGSQKDYGNFDVLVDDKCIEANFTDLASDWLSVPTPPTLDVAKDSNGNVVQGKYKIGNAGGYSMPAGTEVTRLGNPQGNGNFDYVNYNPSGTITWPASGEESVCFSANNFEVSNKTTFVINGPVTVIVGSNCKFNENGAANVVFGPSGSLTIIQTGNHTTIDSLQVKNYVPDRLGDGSINAPANQAAALAAATENYTPSKLKIDCSNGCDVVVHVNERNPLLAAEITAPKGVVRLHAANTQSTFIGRILAHKVETTNGFDFFYDLDSGANSDDENQDGWPLLSWRQIAPSVVPAPAS